MYIVSRDTDNSKYKLFNMKTCETVEKTVAEMNELVKKGESIACFKDNKVLRTFSTPIAYIRYITTRNKITGNNETVIEDFKIIVSDNSVIAMNYVGDDADVTIPCYITDLGYQCFFQNKNIKTITARGMLQKIDSYCFYGCSRLQTVNLNKSNVKICENSAFAFCTNLQNVFLPECIEEIWNECFYSCNMLKQINLGSYLHTLREFAFGYSGIESIEIPSSIYELEHGVFISCESLKYVKINDNTEVIGDSCFSDCTALEKIDLPESLCSIKDYAFDNCTIAEITLPDNIANIGVEVFDKYIGTKLYVKRRSLTEKTLKKQGYIVYNM